MGADGGRSFGRPAPAEGREVGPAPSTIWAPATAAGRAGIAVLRISGPAARDVARALTRREPPPVRQASLRRLVDPTSGAPIDDALLVLFAGPASFTGEDALEIHHHGGIAVLAALGRALSGLPGLRPAEPGEFSRRAFLNGKLDLTAAEAIADLVDATTRAQARQALRQMEGELGRLLEGWRAELLRALALVEAEIDFGAEEGEVGDDLLASQRPALEAVRRAMAEQLAGADRGERLRAGLTVAVIGPPNAGKSSLVNLLARREVAIVTPFAGTTRDVLEVALDLDGWPLTVLDTAGLRESEDPIEREGVARALRRAAGADLRLLVLDAREDPSAALDRHGADADLVVLNKQDLVGGVSDLDARCPVVGVSCATGTGIDRLLAELAAQAARAMDTGGLAVLTRERHRTALTEAVHALDQCFAAPAGTELGLLAEDLRLAARAIGRVTGRIDVEAVLDEVFRRFCIGK